MLGFAGRHDEAVAEAGRAVAIDPESHIARWMQLHALCCRGDDQVAFAMLPDMLASSGRDTWSLTSMAWLRARTGQADAARAAFDEMEARSRFEFVGPFWLAAAASAAGLPDLAFRYAERAVAERDPLVVIARQLPQWNAIRNDPRFPALAAILWQ
jgi:tetratricopeptide (TPR) repeat protein